MWFLQGSFCITGDHRQCKYIKKRRVGKSHSSFLYVFISFFHEKAAIPAKTRVLFYFGKLPDHCDSLQCRGYSHVKMIIAKLYLIIYAVNSACILIVSIVTQFIEDIQHD